MNGAAPALSLCASLASDTVACKPGLNLSYRRNLTAKVGYEIPPNEGTHAPRQRDRKAAGRGSLAACSAGKRPPIKPITSAQRRAESTSGSETLNANTT